MRLFTELGLRCFTSFSMTNEGFRVTTEGFSMTEKDSKAVIGIRMTTLLGVILSTAKNLSLKWRTCLVAI